MPTFIQLHAGASHPVHWRTKGRSTAHLRKGDVSGSLSGFISACSALIVLGVSSRAYVRTAYAVPDGKLEDFFRLGQQSSFGLDEAGMSELLLTVKRFVRTLRFRGRRNWLIRMAVARLREGEVALLCLGDETRQFADWRLAVGVESRADDKGHRVVALLVLDPTTNCSRIAAWNGRLELSGPPNGRHLFYTSGEDGRVRTVTLKCVFTLRRAY